MVAAAGNEGTAADAVSYAYGDRPVLRDFSTTIVRGDKIGVIERFLDIADTILIGGAMCFTFMLAQGYSVGDSLVEPDWVDRCKGFLDGPSSHKLMIPNDVVAMGPDEEVQVFLGDIPDGWKGLDIGPGTRVFEVDCGNGEFLFPFYSNGYIVGGSDGERQEGHDAQKRAAVAGAW